jgi:arabinogalactan endo-1,4-beta-galactosidase
MTYFFRFAWLLILVIHGLVAASEVEPRDFPYLSGGDISALTVYENAGAVYRDAEGNVGDAISLLKDAGMNCFRLRVFVDPDMQGVVTNNLEYTLQLARRVKEAGALLLIDLHYSDTWADPAKQYKPAAWEHLPFDSLLDAVEIYTRTVFQAFIEADIEVDFVQLGNEITNGFLWPDGKVEYDGNDEAAENWDQFSALLLAANRGFEEAYTTLPLPVLFHHIESTGNLKRTDWYIRNLMEHGIPFDAMAFSYYPEWHGDFCGLRATLQRSVELTSKPVLVVETAYFWSPDPELEPRDLILYPMPFTPAGQQQFMTELNHTVKNLEHGMGKGVIYWHPESVRFDSSFHIWKWGNCALFDHNGVILPVTSFDAPLIPENAE